MSPEINVYQQMVVINGKILILGNHYYFPNWLEEVRNAYYFKIKQLLCITPIIIKYYYYILTVILFTIILLHYYFGREI